jgi:hypothetical protein
MRHVGATSVPPTKGAGPVIERDQTPIDGAPAALAGPVDIPIVNAFTEESVATVAAGAAEIELEEFPEHTSIG